MYLIWVVHKWFILTLSVLAMSCTVHKWFILTLSVLDMSCTQMIHFNIKCTWYELYTHEAFLKINVFDMSCPQTIHSRCEVYCT